MEDANLPKDYWSWIDENIELDIGSPLAAPVFIWDDLVENEAVVRSLFPSSPLLADDVKDSDALHSCFTQEDSPDCNPVPLKRRRILESIEGNVVDIHSCLPELSKTSEDFLELYEDLHRVDPSSSGSTWFMTTEESMSSVDDTIEQSSGSWQPVCMSINDSNDAQERAHHQGKPPIDARISKAPQKICPGFVPQNNRAIRSALSSRGHRLRMPTNVVHSTGKMQSTNSCRSNTASPCMIEPVQKQPLQDCSSLRGCPNSVLSYPFALVKPMGIQGDITLQDINERINSTLRRVETYSEQPKSTAASPYSGKSVLACTKIYTEGNGTITIMRTKGS